MWWHCQAFFNSCTTPSPLPHCYQRLVKKSTLNCPADTARHYTALCSASVVVMQCSITANKEDGAKIYDKALNHLPRRAKESLQRHCIQRSSDSYSEHLTEDQKHPRAIILLPDVSTERCIKFCKVEVWTGILYSLGLQLRHKNTKTRNGTDAMLRLCSFLCFCAVVMKILCTRTVAVVGGALAQYLLDQRMLLGGSHC